MPDPQLDLILELCTRAGALMEDAIADAISGAEEDDLACRARLVRLRRATSDIDALVAAAQAIHRTKY